MDTADIAPMDSQTDDILIVEADDQDEQPPAGKYFTVNQVNEFIGRRVLRLRKQFERREANLLRSLAEQHETERKALVAEVARLTRDVLKGS